MEEVSEKKVIELKPLGKWKRILLFLGDFFITFIIAFSLFNVAIFPLAKVIFQTEKKYDDAEKYEREATQLLIDNGFLFKDPSKIYPSFEEDVNYSFKVYLSYYCFDEISPDSNNPQYGHKLENEIIYTYYLNQFDSNQFINDFKNYNQEDSMFEIGEDFASIKLKNDYKELLSAELLEVDDDKYSTHMTNCRDHIFARLFYLKVYQNILDHDFVKNGVSYNNLMQKSREIGRNLQWVAVGSSIFSIVLGWSFAYLIYPLINGDRRSPTMSIMKIDRLNFNNLGPINRKTVLIQSFYSLIMSMAGVVFLPSIYFGLAYVFNLPLLLILSIIAFTLIIGFALPIFINQHNRSGGDILTFIVYVPTEEIDRLYRERLDDGCISSETDSSN